MRPSTSTLDTFSGTEHCFIADASIIYAYVNAMKMNTLYNIESVFTINDDLPRYDTFVTGKSISNFSMSSVIRINEKGTLTFLKSMSTFLTLIKKEKKHCHNGRTIVHIMLVMLVYIGCFLRSKFMHRLLGEKREKEITLLKCF